MGLFEKDPLDVLLARRIEFRLNGKNYRSCKENKELNNLEELIKYPIAFVREDIDKGHLEIVFEPTTPIELKEIIQTFKGIEPCQSIVREIYRLYGRHSQFLVILGIYSIVSINGSNLCNGYPNGYRCTILFPNDTKNLSDSNKKNNDTTLYILSNNNSYFPLLNDVEKQYVCSLGERPIMYLVVNVQDMNTVGYNRYCIEKIAALYINSTESTRSLTPNQQPGQDL